MSLSSENLKNVINEYKIQKSIQPILSIIKNSVDCKKSIFVEINTFQGQQYCKILIDILNNNNIDNTDTIIIVCEALLQQIPLINVRWFLLERCHVLDSLSQQFLSSPNEFVQIKVAKTMQSFLIYSQHEESKSAISEELFRQLFQRLVEIIRGNFSIEYNEASLGLLASLCQMATNGQQVPNIIDDYVILRKQLLRFLSAEMVKRTTIVYIMSIMFHLCNSDDRLFNKRNIRQTLQVLFNIMLNGDAEWASLYAAKLLTEICKSPKTSHLLTEYRTLSSSLKDIIANILGKEKIIIEKHLEFLFVLSKTNSEYKNLFVDIILSWGQTGWSQGGHDQEGNPLAILIKLSNDSDCSIATCAIRLLDEVYVELIGYKNINKLPYLNSLGQLIHQIMLSTASNISSTVHLPSPGEDRDPLVNNIARHITNRNELSQLTKIKYAIQLITNLLLSGDQWLDQIPIFLDNTDKLIKQQIDSNCLNPNVSLLDQSLPLEILLLGAELFIDVLYFYYRATESRPSSSVFGEHLKGFLEQPICPIMLAFGLSAATQSQRTLQRALVLQGVCLHLQDFNVELMGEKMYQFSSEFSALKFEVPSLSKQFNDKMSNCPVRNTTKSEVSSGDNGCDTVPMIPTNETQKRLSSVSQHDEPVLLKTNILSKSITTNQNSAELEAIKNDKLSKSKFVGLTFAEIKYSTISGEQTDRINLDLKVQEIVNRWIDNPESKLSSNEIYSIFEHRIQSLQGQEALMEEIIANKTAALHQSEALLNQYRNNLTSAEKERKQLRNMQMEHESRFESINKMYEQQKCKMIELEMVNQKLIDTNRTNEKHKEECLVISKKLQERLVKVSEEKSRLQINLDRFEDLIEDLKKTVSLKEVQITNYIQVTKLINKLTGNNFPEEGISGKINVDDLTKLIKSPPRTEYDCSTNTNNSNHIIYNDKNNNNTKISPQKKCNDHPAKRTVSIIDFLHLYKNNSQ